MTRGVIADGIMVMMLKSTSRHRPVANHHGESAVDRCQHEPCRDERPQQEKTEDDQGRYSSLLSVTHPLHYGDRPTSSLIMSAALP